MTNEDEFIYSPVDNELTGNLELEEEEWLPVQPIEESDEDGNKAQQLTLSDVDEEILSFRRGVDVADNIKDDVFDYLQKIAKTPLLTPVEEVQLFEQFSAATQRIEELFQKLPPPILQRVQCQLNGRRGAKPKPTHGRWWSPMEIGTILEQISIGIEAYHKGRTEENQGEKDSIETLWNQLTAAAEAMEAVREQIVRANLLLVASVVKGHHFNRSSLSFLDLMQEGSIGLMRAVGKFDLGRGCKFSTYAYWWIMQAIQRALIQQNRTIRIPDYVGAVRQSITDAQTRLARELERQPSLKEIALAVEMDESCVVEILQSARGAISLSSPLFDSTDTTISDSLADDSHATPEEVVLCLSEKEGIDRVLSTLSQREKLVIQLRYGLTDGREYTLREIGPRLGVSRERVRQIQDNALRKLRHPIRKEALKELL